MAYSTVQYTGNGTQTNFSVPFPYLYQSDVKVSVNGVVSTGVSFVSGNVIKITPAPPAGSAVLVSRQTSIAAQAVTFVDGSTIQAMDLNAQSQQDLYISQEAYDRAAANISLDTATG